MLIILTKQPHLLTLDKIPGAPYPTSTAGREVKGQYDSVKEVHLPILYIFVNFCFSTYENTKQKH